MIYKIIMFLHIVRTRNVCISHLHERRRVSSLAGFAILNACCLTKIPLFEMGGYCFYFYFLAFWIWFGLAEIILGHLEVPRHPVVQYATFNLKAPLTWRPYHPRFSYAIIRRIFKGSILGRHQKMTDSSVRIWGTVDWRCSSGFSLSEVTM